jgi:hypothetical protein
MPHARFGLVVLLGLFGTQSTVAKDDGPGSSPEQRLAFARRAAGEYRFRLPGRRRSPDDVKSAGRDTPAVQLYPEALLRWNNQVVREDDGMLFLWTDGEKGRPVATAQFFLVESVWHHEFQSLSQEGFVARFEGDVGRGWEPDRPGLEFVAADQVDAPAASPAQRLRQMKAIAERFTAAVDQDEKFTAPEQLRLLTTPIYRYAAASEGLLDGALFAFTQGTNPEVLMLVEAYGTDPTKITWRYGFARMSSFNLRVYRDGHVVWKGVREVVPTPDRASPYFFRWKAQPDDSAEIDVPARKAK